MNPPSTHAAGKAPPRPPARANPLDARTFVAVPPPIPPERLVYRNATTTEGVSLKDKPINPPGSSSLPTGRFQPSGTTRYQRSSAAEGMAAERPLDPSPVLPADPQDDTCRILPVELLDLAYNDSTVHRHVLWPRYSRAEVETHIIDVPDDQDIEGFGPVQLGPPARVRIENVTHLL